MRSRHGFVVMILGADGSGKSTLVDALCAAFPDEAVRAYFGEKEFRIELAARALAALQRGALGRLPARALRFLYEYLLLPLDLLCRRRRLAGAEQPSVVVIDRVPGFPFVSGRMVQRRLYRAVLPKPSLVVLLEGDPATLASRKHDATIAGISYDTAKFRQVARSLDAPHIVEIDTTLRDRAQTLSQVAGEVRRRFMNRTE